MKNIRILLDDLKCFTGSHDVAFYEDFKPYIVFSLRVQMQHVFKNIVFVDLVRSFSLNLDDPIIVRPIELYKMALSPYLFLYTVYSLKRGSYIHITEGPFKYYVSQVFYLFRPPPPRSSISGLYTQLRNYFKIPVPSLIWLTLHDVKTPSSNHDSTYKSILLC